MAAETNVTATEKLYLLIRLTFIINIKPISMVRSNPAPNGTTLAPQFIIVMNDNQSCFRQWSLSVDKEL
ncbi:hypothetical protein T12_8418 [Trichinella patagoniensis]|uniref:Uncharacterized protein n=1 Tax=Trichinella patagoniensis TaxID=990121 RepID=A0A0V0ZNQ9_9BILA|nr:hypothetical protein T12_8418 [Trichinella patagoniensis]